MIDPTPNRNSNCPRIKIAAYIDGDLDPHAELEFERHVEFCPDCAAELNDQKRLLQALDFALDDPEPLRIPENFTRVVVAKAESNVQGLRCPRERNRALFVCLALFLIGLVGLGAESSRTLATFGAVSEQFFAVGSFLAQILQNFAVATTVFLRSFCLQFVYKSAVSVMLAVAVFGISLLIFSRLVFTGRKV